MTSSNVPSEDDPSSRRISLRAILTGILLCGVIGAGLPYTEFVLKGTQLGTNSSTPAAFFLLFILLLMVQPVLGTVRRTWLFTRQELLAMTVMMMIATVIPTRGFTALILAVISGAFYYATPENHWEDKLIPDLPTWIVPGDVEAIKMFYEGLPQGQPVPWGAWVAPLAWWLVLMAAFYTVLVCSMIIVRRQWMDNERLLYPMVQVPLAMVEDRDPRARFKPFLKSPLMWVGFSIPFIYHSVNALSHYYPFVPQIGRTYSLLDIFRLGPQFGYAFAVEVRIDFMMLGLAYLISTNISFSTWFFYLLAKAQETIFAVLGIYSNQHLDEFSYTGPTVGMLSHQTMGAMFVLVLLGLWTARPHLATVWRQIWRVGERQDTEELLSYRTAAVGVLLGMMVMAIWLWSSGLPWWAVLMFLAGAFTVYYALTRIIVEAGMMAAMNGISPAGFVVSGAGSEALGTSGMMGIGFTMGWANEMLVFMMAPIANGLRLLHGIKRSKGRILFMIGAAMAVTMVVSLCTTLKLGYTYGAINLERQYFVWNPQEPFRFMLRYIANPTGPYWSGWGWTAVGAAVMSLLTLARYRFAAWPLHPLGYMAAGTWTLNRVWFSIFLAWLIKALILKYSGPRGYRALRWFFIGMVLGQFVVAGFWLIIDSFTGMIGNSIRLT